MANESEVKTKITTEDKTGPGTKSAQNNFSKLKNTLGDTVKQMTGLDLATIGIAGTLTFAANQVRKGIDNYSNYAEKIDKMTMSTKMSAEEMSRLSQVADDFRVDMGQLEGALGLAVKNGFNPTTENLAVLADKIHGINDPTKLANELVPIFGKSWENLLPLLSRGGDAIREASAGIADGLIVTQKSIDENRAYEKSIDDLEDSWTAFANTMAKKALPPLTDVMNTLNLIVAWEDKTTDAINDNNKGVVAASGSYKEYIDIQKMVYKNAGLVVTSTKDGLKVTTNYANGLRDVTGQYNLMTEAQYDAVKAGREYGPTIEELTGAVEVANEEMRYFDEHLDNQAAKARNAAGAISEAAAASDALKASQDNFAQGTANTVAQMLEEGYISADKLKEGYQAVDDASGTTLSAQQELRDGQQELVDKFKAGKLTAGEFRDGLKELNAMFGPVLDPSIEASRELVEKLIDQIKEFEGVHWAVLRVRLEGELNGGNGNGGGPTGSSIAQQEKNYGVDLNGNGIIGAKSGLSGFRVPPGYDEMTGRPFMVAVSSGETVDVAPNGKGRYTGATINYNLTAVTSQTPKVVEHSFSIMRAISGV